MQQLGDHIGNQRTFACFYVSSFILGEAVKKTVSWQGRLQAFSRGGQQILLFDFDQKSLHFQRGTNNIMLSHFDQKSLHLSKCLLSMNNNDIIVYN